MTFEFCASCGLQGRPRDRFCRACGEPLFDSATSDQAPFDIARALADAGRIDEAIASLKTALAEGQSAELHVALATLYLRRGGGAAAAMGELDRALERDPSSGVAHAYVGALLVATGRIEDGVTHLDRARDLAPNDIIVAIKRAEYWLRIGVLDRARSELRAALLNGGGEPDVRAVARELLESVNGRVKSSFVRRTVALPGLPRISRALRRRSQPAVPALAEIEVSP